MRVTVSGRPPTIGPSLRRLTQAEDPKRSKAVLRGHEGDPDYLAARQFAHALGWADVFLLSDLPRETVEELSQLSASPAPHVISSIPILAARARDAPPPAIRSPQARPVAPMRKSAAGSRP